MFVVVKVQEFVHYVPRFAGVCEQFLREMADLFSERILFSKVFYFGRILFSTVFGAMCGFLHLRMVHDFTRFTQEMARIAWICFSACRFFILARILFRRFS